MPHPLAPGDPAPDFERPDQSGAPLRLSSLRGKPVVLFFYPKDHTPGCTAQACAFRDAYQQFQSAGAEVLGISSGSPDAHASFAQSHRLPFRLIADDGAIRAAFGVPKTLWLFPGRVTYVLDAQGVIRHVFNSQLQVGRHIQDALAVVQRLAAPAP